MNNNIFIKQDSSIPLSDRMGIDKPVNNFRKNSKRISLAFGVGFFSGMIGYGVYFYSPIQIEGFKSSTIVSINLPSAAHSSIVPADQSLNKMPLMIGVVAAVALTLLGALAISSYLNDRSKKLQVEAAVSPDWNASLLPSQSESLDKASKSSRDETHKNFKETLYRDLSSTSLPHINTPGYLDDLLTDVS